VQCASVSASSKAPKPWGAMCKEWIHRLLVQALYLVWNPISSVIGCTEELRCLRLPKTALLHG
jgi:hypothetical protein